MKTTTMKTSEMRTTRKTKTILTATLVGALASTTTVAQVVDLSTSLGAGPLPS
jgi:hypothetical protein